MLPKFKTHSTIPKDQPRRLKFTKNKIGLGTSLTCSCKEDFKVGIPHKKVDWGNKYHTRNIENYWSNVRYVQAMKQVGCCVTEVELEMAFLNLSNSSNMKSVAFHKIKGELGKYIWSMVEEDIQLALEEELSLPLVKRDRVEG